ncbi:hypothetical protein Tco_1131655 [Tanacetum coccineum]
MQIFSPVRVMHRGFLFNPGLSFGFILIVLDVFSILLTRVGEGWLFSDGKDAMDRGCGLVTLNSSSTLLAPSTGDCESVVFFPFSSDSGRLGCRVPRMEPNVEVNLCRLLVLGKCRAQLGSSGAWSFISQLKVRKSTVSWSRGVNPRSTPA